MAVASYVASLRTRKTTSSSNTYSNAAAQEFYSNSYNYVGIVHFAGLSLANKIVTGVQLTVTASNAGYGTGTIKTVYLCKSNYQAASQTGATGFDYAGDSLGTFSGTFWGNTSSYTLSGSLLANVAAYLQAGNNTFCLFNPFPYASPQGYSYNYLQWTSCTMTVTYEEGISQPSTSASTVEMGKAITIYTNRVSTAATHSLSYSFGSVNYAISVGTADFVTWTPPLSLAAQIPSATSGLCTIYCSTYIGDVLTGTRTCTVTLTVPSSVVPTISSIADSEATAGLAAQFGNYVRGRSTLSVKISAAGAQGSSISSYRAIVNGSAYTASSFVTGTLNTAGSNTISVTVTDSRGRTATSTKTISVLDYASPRLTRFVVERCSSTGAVQMDGNRVRVSSTASASAVGNKNTMSCAVYYKTASASAWTLATSITPANYAITTTNLLLAQTFDPLSSYDFRVTVTDYFSSIEQTASVGTKQVMMDFFRDGTGIAFGKVAETSGRVEFGWPLTLASPLGVAYGGTGASTPAAACAAIGAVAKTGDTMTGNLSIQNTLYPSLYLLPTQNATTNRTVFEGSYVGASSFSSWEDSSGNNRRMIEVRNKSYAASLDNAVMVRVCDNGTWGNYRVFHAGMPSPVPIANGGTGAANAASARALLGTNVAENITSGTLPMARLPFKVAYGSGSVNGNTALFINYSSAGFTYVPYVITTYSTTAGNWSGDNGAIKVYSKTTTYAYVIVGGSFSTSRDIDWIAIGI